MRLLIALVVFLFAVPAWAQNNPVALTYQGHQADAGGQAVSGLRAVTFRLYGPVEDGDPFWTEGHEETEVVDGRFTSVRGLRTAFEAPLMDEEALYLGIQIGDGVEMMPRMRVGGVLRTQWTAVAAHARDVQGEDIHPATVSIGEQVVINAAGDRVSPAAGLQGERGEAGAQGSQGERGEQGPKGDRGEQGAQGLQGGRREAVLCCR